MIDKKKKKGWLDLSPFIDYMQDIFEDSMVNAKLANNTLSETQRKILERMNRAGKNAEITVQKAVEITKLTADGTRKALNGLANEGYLTIDKSRKKYVYKLSQYWPVDSMDGSI